MAFQTAELTDRVVGAGEDIEIVAVTVGAAARFALPEVQILGAGDHNMIVDDILCGLCQVPADLLHAFDLVVLHDDILAPGEEIVVNDLPAGGHGQHGVVGLHAAGPVGAADTNKGDGLLHEDAGIQAFLALLLELAVQHHQHAGIVTGTHPVAENVEQAGTAGLVNRINDQDAVGLDHLFIEGGVVVLLGTDHTLAHH